MELRLLAFHVPALTDLILHFTQGDDESVRSRDARPEYASEILDEFTTHRGELKRRNSSFRDGRLLQVTFCANNSVPPGLVT